MLIDNAPYDKKQVDLNPTSASRQDAIKDWLKSQDIGFDIKVLKVDLRFLVKQHKHRFLKYRIDAIKKKNSITNFTRPTLKA